MDLGTIIGLAMAFGAILAAMLMQGQQLGTMINVPSMIIVGFGTLGAGLIGTSLAKALGMVGVLKKALKSEAQDPTEIVATLVDFANKARREGLLSLESDVGTLDDRFLRLGLQLVVDGSPPELVRDILETEIAAKRARHGQGIGFFSSLSAFAPALGVIGTVMGLIAMLQDLSDPGNMGPAIATAFLTTLYGAVLANIVFAPLSNKLKRVSQEELHLCEMALEGIMGLQAGDNPFLVQAKMTAFLPAELRDQLEAGVDASANVPAEVPADEPAGEPAGEPEMVGAE